jgi:ankyrin repeat protein
LLAKGLEINKVAKSGGTALMFAAGGGHNETCKVLLEAKADPNIVVAATEEYIEQVAKAIAEGKEDVEEHKDGVTALMVAAQGGHIGCVELLINAKADVLAVDDEDVSALIYAIKGNHISTAKYLVEHGANPNDMYVDDKSKKHNLLMDAVVNNNLEFALSLISSGANVSYADDDGVTVATQAAYLGQLEVVKMLMSKNADFVTANNEGINPLIAAASEGNDSSFFCLALHINVRMSSFYK